VTAFRALLPTYLLTTDTAIIDSLSCIAYLVPEVVCEPCGNLVRAGVVDFVLKESGNIEEYGENGDKGDMDTSLFLDGVRVGSGVWTTHGQVAIDRHQHCQVYRTCVRYKQNSGSFSQKQFAYTNVKSKTRIYTKPCYAPVFRKYKSSLN